MTDHDQEQVQPQLAAAQERIRLLEAGVQERAAMLEHARDLLEEHGTHGDDWPDIAPAIERVLGKLTAAEARIAAVRALHHGEGSKWGDGGLQCYICREPTYPCATVAALGGCSAEAQETVPNNSAAPGRNAEDCPACDGANPPYPFLCPGHPADVPS